MSTENRSGSYFDNLNLGIPATPPIERGDAPELNAWADDRMAIYASLDAAMTHHIVEAVRALNELKRWVEEDARQTMLALGNERETLQQEVKALRQEKNQLQEELRQAERQLEEARATKLAATREAQDLLRESETERERLQREIARLTSQMDTMGHQLQNFMQERFNQLWENFVDSMSSPGQPLPSEPETPAPTVRKDKLATNPPENKVDFEKAVTPPPGSIEDKDEKEDENNRQSSIPNPQWPAEDLKPVVFESESFSPHDSALSPASVSASPQEKPFEFPLDIFELEEFDDTPTPRLAGGSPVIRPDKKAPPETDLDLSDWRSKMEPEHDLSLPRRGPESSKPAEKPQPAALSTSTDSERARRERERSQEIEQRLERWFGKREITPPPAPPVEALPATEAPEAEQDKVPDFVFEGESVPLENKVPEFVFEPAEEKPEAQQLENLQFGDKPTVVPKLIRPAIKGVEKERERAELEEIGAKLGFDVITPPSISAVRFARGFNPAGRVARPAAPSLGAGFSGANVAPQSPQRPLQDVVPTVDYVPESLPTEVMPKIIDFKTRSRSGETITPRPTGTSEGEPTTPAPRIGEIGDDFAHQFPMRDMPLPPLPLTPPHHLEPEPLRRIGSVPMPQPPGGPNSERSSEGDIETKLTISNLQGLSLLMMEKVVRGLSGIHHVTVTDFRKGVLEMDVRHAPDVKLDEVLPAMPELKLTLVERGPNSLEFLQER